MTDRAAARLAGALVVVAVVLAVVAGVLQYITRDVEVEYFGIRGFQGVFGVIIAAIGWLVATRRHRNPIGWIFAVVGVISAVQGFDSAYITYSISEHDGTLPGTEFLVWVSVWIWVLIVAPLATFVLLLFPEGRLTTKRQRAIAVYAGIATVVMAATVSLTPGQAGETPAGTENPFSLAKEQHDPIMAVSGMMLIAAVALSIGILIGRFRRATGDVRQQMKWLTYAGAVAGVTISASVFVLGSAESAQDGPVRIMAIAVIVAFVGIPVAAGLAVLRYGLYEIDVVINKTIVYAALAVFITIVYASVVVGIGALVGAGDNAGLSIAATAIVAVAIQPVRARVNHLANRVVFGKRSSPYEALSEFSARLSEQTTEALPQLARLMTEATAADRAHVWIAVGAEMVPVGSWPQGREASSVPISSDEPTIPNADRVYLVRHEGELLGALTVSTPPNDPLTSTEDRLLSDLASQAGLLLRNARLIEELRASRQRLVAAQNMERRRIERDLHDGAQQQLVALAVNLRLLGRLVSEPPEAREMIERLQNDTTEALENLRDLARGIYPPMLAERGLVAALASQASKAPIAVDVEGAGVGRYPQEAESALYFCALEALQNVAKYAHASSAKVRVFATDHRLGFEVRDDGAGFDVRTAKRGSGLTNMADRLEALGGRLEIRSRPGEGTTVTGWVPTVAMATTDAV